MSETPLIFNRALHARRRDRAAAWLADHDFLFREVAERLADRVLDVNRQFARALDLGDPNGDALRATGRIDRLFQADLSEGMARRARTTYPGTPTLVADEETLPFAEASLDLIFSAMTLHWVNDLPGALVQMRRALKPNGLLLAALAGAGTLKELHTALARAESEITGGMAPHISPFADVRDLGNLLTRAGFALPVADTETITVSYPDMFRLMADLRGMGEGNALLARHERGLRRDTMARAVEIYAETYADADGRLPATFEIVFLTGWAPAAGQQQPLKPGSAETSLKDALS